MKYAPNDHLRVVNINGDDEIVVLSGFFRVTPDGERLMGAFKGRCGHFTEVAESQILPEA